VGRAYRKKRAIERRAALKEFAASYKALEEPTEFQRRFIRLYRGEAPSPGELGNGDLLL
jgi:hypothetical protein